MSLAAAPSPDAKTFQSYLKAYAALAWRRGGRRAESVAALCGASLRECEPGDMPNLAFGYSSLRTGIWLRPGSKGILKLYGGEGEEGRFSARRAAWRRERIEAAVAPGDIHERWKERGVLQENDLSTDEKEQLGRANVVLPEAGMPYLGAIVVSSQKSILWVSLSQESVVGEAWVENWIAGPDVAGWSVSARTHVGEYEKNEQRLRFVDKWHLSLSSPTSPGSYVFAEGRLSRHVVGVDLAIETLPSKEMDRLPSRRLEVVISPGSVLPFVAVAAAFRERIKNGWRVTRLLPEEDAVGLQVRQLSRSPSESHLLGLLITVPTAHRQQYEESFTLSARVFFEDGLRLEGEWTFPVPETEAVKPRRGKGSTRRRS